MDIASHLFHVRYADIRVVPFVRVEVSDLHLPAVDAGSPYPTLS
jgi:hypothetical protein